MASHLDYYARMARTVSDLTQLSGRYSVQSEAERLVVADVAEKLRLEPGSDLLEIGCGPGNLLIPLSFMVSRCVGVDHPDVIDVFRRRYSSETIELIGGDFLETDIGQTFDRILVYSVLPTMPDRECLFAFVDKALERLRPDGRMLLGDLNNIDKKRRFEASERGAEFDREWKRLRDARPMQPVDGPTDDVVRIDDALILDIVGHLRDRGWHALICEQPQNLPFGNTREDILVVGPEYADQPGAPAA